MKTWLRHYLRADPTDAQELVYFVVPLSLNWPDAQLLILRAADLGYKTAAVTSNPDNWTQPHEIRLYREVDGNVTGKFWLYPVTQKDADVLAIHLYHSFFKSKSANADPD